MATKWRQLISNGDRPYASLSATAPQRTAGNRPVSFLMSDGDLEGARGCRAQWPLVARVARAEQLLWAQSLTCLSVLLGSWSIDTANCPRQLLGNGVATEFPSEPSISPPTSCLPSRTSRVRIPSPAPTHTYTNEGWAKRPAFFASKRRPSAF